MFKLQRLEISGFKSFADYTEVVFTGSGITAVVGPNGCGKSNVSDAISWVLGEQRAKSLRGGEMKDVVFAGTRNRKPGGMAEVVLHLVRDDSVPEGDESALSDIDAALSGIDDAAVDMDTVEGLEEVDIQGHDEILDADQLDTAPDGLEADETETVKAMAVGSAHVVESRVKTKRHWRPRSFALDFAPGEAVSVTRRLYLSGESEYQLNGKTCRLRDITDLFAGTGLSGAHYAIIEQGRIGQILSAKPADRRSLIEEAAGISKFRARQRAAESRLDSAKTNLSRISDIMSEVDTQVNSLRRQAAKTRRFKVLQEEFRTQLKQLYAAEGLYLTDLSNELEDILQGRGQAEAELHTEVGEQEEAARAATQRARDAEEALAELRKIHAHNLLERDRAEREHIYKSDQIVALNSRGEVLRTEIAAGASRIASLEREISELKRAEESETAMYEEAAAQLQLSEEAYKHDASELAVIENSIESLRAELIQHTAAAERFDEIARQLEHNLERLHARADSLKKEGDRAEETFDSNTRQAEELVANLAGEESKLADLNREKEALQAETDGARAALREAEAQRALLQEEYSAKRHRLSTLKELEEKKAVYAPQVQKLFSSQAAMGVELDGVLADRFSVDREAERAVEALFGNFLQAVVVESAEAASKVTKWLGSNNVGMSAVLVLPNEDSKSTSVPDGTITDRLGISQELADILHAVFPREMSARLVKDLGSAGDQGQLLVNYEGEMLLGGRLYIGGRKGEPGKNSSLLAFKRELSQLQKDCSRLEAEIATAEAKVGTAREDLILNESKTVDLQSLIIKVDRGIHGLQIQVHAARDVIARAERHRKVVLDEADQTSREIADVEIRRKDAVANHGSAESAKHETTAAIEAIAGDLTRARTTAENSMAVLNQRRMAAATSDERRRAATSALRRLDNEAKESRDRAAQLEVELTETDEKVKQLRAAITEITDRIANAGSAIQQEDADLARAVQALNEAREFSDSMSETLADLHRKSAEARDQRAEIEIRRAEIITRLHNVRENCQQELNADLQQLVAETELQEDLVLDDARQNAEDLRQRLEGFGAINMLALEELGEAEERQLFLNSQHADVIDSIAATEDALREIKQRSRERFRSAFEAINENFKQFFVELFGGGRGEMVLLESDDILEAGIEVVAQPPGKRLQNIMLLSGGEKAMTAIGLVLAIFKYRPSPFCLLDEVDAPLDDANVGRFAAKIAEMSEKTQFIVITHNKRTMEAAKALYGVTMQEPGISKIVSVKFE